MSGAARRLSIVAVTVVVVIAAIGFGVHRLVDDLGKPSAGESCQAGAYTISTDQAAVASTMVGVVLQRGLPERAAVLALAAALQESKLRNLPSGAGDRDSVGVLQQRPSQGWGTIAQLSDLHFATGAFLDALVKVPDWQTKPLADAIQAVQISADGSAYAPHEGEAQALADALTGKTPAGLTCTFPVPTEVASTASVAGELATDLPVNQPTTNGQTVQIAGASWATTAWCIANADRLGIDSVAYDQKQWTRAKGWQDDPSAGSDAVLVTMHKP